jgi:hypothetical protein
MKLLISQNETLNGAKMELSAAARIGLQRETRIKLSIKARIKLSIIARIGLQDNRSRTIRISQKI